MAFLYLAEDGLSLLLKFQANILLVSRYGLFEGCESLVEGVCEEGEALVVVGWGVWGVGGGTELGCGRFGGF